MNRLSIAGHLNPMRNQFQSALDAVPFQLDALSLLDAKLFGAQSARNLGLTEVADNIEEDVFCQLIDIALTDEAHINKA
jgi:hypothetical protein